MKKENIKKEPINLNSKLESAIRILIEKLTQSGIDTKDKEIIIKNGALTIN